MLRNSNVCGGARPEFVVTSIGDCHGDVRGDPVNPIRGTVWRRGHRDFVVSVEKRDFVDPEGLVPKEQSLLFSLGLSIAIAASGDSWAIATTNSSCERMVVALTEGDTDGGAERMPPCEYDPVDRIHPPSFRRMPAGIGVSAEVGDGSSLNCVSRGPPGSWSHDLARESPCFMTPPASVLSPSGPIHNNAESAKRHTS